MNSTTDASLNGRSVSLQRWNTHYLLPKANNGNDDPYPPSPLPAPFNPYPPVPTGFTPPDWVFLAPNPNDLTQESRKILTAPDPNVVGRFAYTVYSEGGLLDMNVAGYPTGTATTQSGRKGSIAYADLTALGTYPIPNGPPPAGAAYQVDKLVGWRNYATTQPNNLFGNSNFAANFQSSSVPATNFYTYVVNNTSGFLSPNATTWNNRTDQAFVQRQELIAFRKTTQFSVNALPYLSTFSRETNAPSFSPSTPAGSTIDYATLANTDPAAINPNFLLRRATSSFTRFDGTTANIGEPLVKTRFPLSRLAWVTYKGPSAVVYAANNNDPVITALTTAGVSLSTIKAGTVINVKACFGLTFPTGGTAGSPWTYTNPTGTTAATRILRLDEVAGAAREPDFFELLQAGVLSGSLGQDTGGPGGTRGVTGGDVFPDIHMNSAYASHSSRSERQSSTRRTLTQFRCAFNSTPAEQSGPLMVWRIFRTSRRCIRSAGTSPNDSTKWATYLTFQLWNPHQNASTLPNNVRLRLDGAIGIFKGGNGETWVSGTTPQIIANGNTAGQSVTLNPAVSFSAPAPLTNVDTTNAVAAPGPAAGGAFAILAAPPVPP